MKLTINQNDGIREPEVIINCGKIDGRIRGLIDTIRQHTITLEGELDGSIYQIPLETVIYIDSVDKRTFFYDRFRIFRSEKSLASLEAALKNACFLRISKNCIINLSLVQRMIPHGDRKARVVMAGGECLEVGRAYRSVLLECLRQTDVMLEKGNADDAAWSSREISCTERAVRNAGEVLTFHVVPRRVVVLSYSAAELVCALGAEDTMAAIAPAEDILEHTTARYRSALERLPVLRHCGDGVPTIEELKALDPDLVICGWYYPQMIGKSLRERSGIPFYITESTMPEKAGLERLYQDILNLGRIFRAEDRAIALTEQMRQRIAVLTRRLSRRRPVRVFVYDGQQYEPFTAGRGTLEHELISAAGGKNVFGHLEGSYHAVSWMEVAEAAPEVIILHDYLDSMTREEKINYLKSRPELQNVSAICQERFVSLTLTEVFPGIQCAKAVEKMIRVFHPDTL